MRRGVGWGAAILVILLLVGVGIGAYTWGVTEGLERARDGVDAVRHVGHGYGFFPIFPFFLLLLLGLFAVKAMWWGGRWGHDHPHGPAEHGHGPGHGGFEEYHRRLHEGEAAGGEPSG